MKRLALSVVTLAFLAAPALAQQPKPAEPPKKHKVLDIEAIDVDGDRVTRPLEPISVADAAKSSSLIRIRRDFIDMILKAAEGV